MTNKCAAAEIFTQLQAKHNNYAYGYFVELLIKHSNAGKANAHYVNTGLKSPRELATQLTSEGYKMIEVLCGFTGLDSSLVSRACSDAFLATYQAEVDPDSELAYRESCAKADAEYYARADSAASRAYQDMAYGRD